MQQSGGVNRCRSIYKPGSVHSKATGWSFIWDNCYQLPQATYPSDLQGADAQRAFTPIWSCSGWGLPCHFGYPKRGALLPHLFTLALASGIFSVALSLKLALKPAPADVIRHLALWSPDFPRESFLIPATIRLIDSATNIRGYVKKSKFLRDNYFFGLDDFSSRVMILDCKLTKSDFSLWISCRIILVSAVKGESW